MSHAGFVYICEIRDYSLTRHLLKLSLRHGRTSRNRNEKTSLGIIGIRMEIDVGLCCIAQGFVHTFWSHDVEPIVTLKPFS